MSYTINIIFRHIVDNSIQETDVELDKRMYEFDSIIKASKKTGKQAKVSINGLKVWGQYSTMLLSQKDSFCANNSLRITTKYGQLVFNGTFNPKDCEFDDCIASIGRIKHNVIAGCEDLPNSVDKNYYDELLSAGKITSSNLLGEYQELICRTDGVDGGCLDCQCPPTPQPDPTIPNTCGNSSEYYLISNVSESYNKTCCVAQYDVNEQGGGCYEWADVLFWNKTTKYSRVVATTSSNTTPPDTVHSWEIVDQINNSSWLWKRQGFSTNKYPVFTPNGVNLFDLLEAIFQCKFYSHMFSRYDSNGIDIGVVPNTLPNELSMYETEILSEYGNLNVHQMGDVMDPNATSLSHLFKMNGDTLKQDLEKMFNVEFRKITDGTNFGWQVEHINWWDNEDNGCTELIEVESKITFVPEKNIKRERWLWRTPSSEEWKSNDKFDYTCGHDTKEYKVSLLSTDVAFIASYIESGSNQNLSKADGYVLIACSQVNQDGKNYVIRENEPLNWDTLLDRFHIWNRPSGTVINSNGTFSHVGTERIEKRTAIGDVKCGIFDIEKAIGVYSVTSSEWNIETNIVKLKLLK